jgi:hypothetical protein
MFFKQLLKANNLDPKIFDVVSKLTPFQDKMDEPELIFIPIKIENSIETCEIKDPEYLH